MAVRDRTGGEAGVSTAHPWRDVEELRELYVEEKLTTREVGDELGCSRRTVEDWIHRHDIETRSRTPDPPSELQSESDLRRVYRDEGLSTYAIADQLDCAPSTVHDWLCRHDIETRAVGSQPGDLHHRWKGEHQPYYGNNRHERRRAALDRDDQQCRVCGIDQRTHEDEHGMGLDVHHVTPIREFEEPTAANELGNLVTLCRACHNRIDPKNGAETIENE